MFALDSLTLFGTAAALFVTVFVAMLYHKAGYRSGCQGPDSP